MTEPIDYAKLESAIGLNWYELDPNLSSLIDQYLAPQDRGWARRSVSNAGARSAAGPSPPTPR